MEPFEKPTKATMVRLKYPNGELSDLMPRERAAFIVAFTLSGERPKIIECDLKDRDTDVPVMANGEQIYIEVAE